MYITMSTWLIVSILIICVVIVRDPVGSILEVTPQPILGQEKSNPKVNQAHSIPCPWIPVDSLTIPVLHLIKC